MLIQGTHVQVLNPQTPMRLQRVKDLSVVELSEKEGYVTQEESRYPTKTLKHTCSFYYLGRRVCALYAMSSPSFIFKVGENSLRSDTLADTFQILMMWKLPLGETVTPTTLSFWVFNILLARQWTIQSMKTALVSEASIFLDHAPPCSFSGASQSGR